MKMYALFWSCSYLKCWADMFQTIYLLSHWNIIIGNTKEILQEGSASLFGVTALLSQKQSIITLEKTVKVHIGRFHMHGPKRCSLLSSIPIVFLDAELQDLQGFKVETSRFPGARSRGSSTTSTGWFNRYLFTNNKNHNVTISNKTTHHSESRKSRNELISSASS